MSIDAIGHFGSGRIAQAIASTSDKGGGQSIEDFVRFEQLKHRSVDRGALNHDVSYSQETISCDFPHHPVTARLSEASDYEPNCFETSNTPSNESLPNDQNIRCYEHGCDRRGFSLVGNFVQHQREKMNHEVSYSQETISYDFPRHPVTPRLYEASDYKSSRFETSNTLSNKSLPNDQNIRCYDHGCDGRGFSSVGNFVRHQREKSDKANRFVCHFCGQFFTRQTARNLHVSRRRCKIWRPGFGAASCNETTPQEFVNGSEYSTVVSSEGPQYQFFKSRLGSDEALAMTNSISGYDFFTATQSI